MQALFESALIERELACSFSHEMDKVDPSESHQLANALSQLEREGGSPFDTTEGSEGEEDAVDLCLHTLRDAYASSPEYGPQHSPPLAPCANPSHALPADNERLLCQERIVDDDLSRLLHGSKPNVAHEMCTPSDGRSSLPLREEENPHPEALEAMQSEEAALQQVHCCTLLASWKRCIVLWAPSLCSPFLCGALRHLTFTLSPSPPLPSSSPLRDVSGMDATGLPSAQAAAFSAC